MDEIDRQDIEKTRSWLAARTKIQRTINQIKIMLWAGDYGRAQQELAQVYENYAEQFFDRSLNVKTNLTSLYRKKKGTLEQKYRQRGIKGKELEQHVQEELAVITRLRNPVEDGLYLLSPIVSAIQKLQEQVPPDTLQKPLLMHKTSGFCYSIASTGRYRWEMRAYHINDVQIEPQALIASLSHHLAEPLFSMRKADHNSWPLWYRSFWQYNLLEYKFYTAKRFVVDITRNDNTDFNQLINIIFDAISEVIDSS